MHLKYKSYDGFCFFFLLPSGLSKISELVLSFVSFRLNLS